jgi:hypothetical protein
MAFVEDHLTFLTDDFVFDQFLNSEKAEAIRFKV